MHTIFRSMTLFLICLFLAAACAPKPAFDPLSVAPGMDPDPEFLEAVAEAHATIGDFYAAFFSPSPTQSFAGLRVRFHIPGSDQYEYHWTEFVDYYNGIYTVRLIDSVTLGTGHHPDRTVAVHESEVMDWVVIEQDGTFIGGYSLRLAYSRMTAEEKRQFREKTGYVMD